MNNIGALSDNSRLAASIMAIISQKAALTDLIIQEGHPIRAKTASGIEVMDSLVVEAADIQHFFANYVEQGVTRSMNYWKTDIEPLLVNRQAVNRSLPTGTDKYLRFSLFQHQRGRLAMVVRVTTPPPALDDVGLTDKLISRIKTSPRGLVIITGPTASGKTSTALSILDWLNHNTAGHIVTVEDPIEYPMRADKCVFTQREVGLDVASFGDGLRDAMRQAPEAILAGEVRDRDTAEAAVLGGESGALMLVTTHGKSVTGTLRKILTLTGDSTSAMRAVLAGSLLGVVRQELVPKADGSGYVLVADTLHATGQVRGLIEEGNWNQLDSMTRPNTPANKNFQSMAMKLRSLVENGVIAKSEEVQLVGPLGDQSRDD